MAFDQTPSHLLFIINRDAHGLLSLLFRDVPGHTRAPTHFMRDYLLSMTAFSMMSTAIFSFPTVLETDRLNNWQKVLRHTPVSMVEYYLIKVAGLFVDFLLSIGVVFTVGHVVRHVNMSLQGFGS